MDPPSQVGHEDQRGLTGCTMLRTGPSTRKPVVSVAPLRLVVISVRGPTAETR